MVRDSRLQENSETRTPAVRDRGHVIDRSDMDSRWIASAAALAVATGCVPSGSNAGVPDAAPASQPIARAVTAASSSPPSPSDILRGPFAADFSRTAQRPSPAQGD